MPHRETRSRSRLRIPGWARGEASPGGLYRFVSRRRAPEKVALRVNGRPIAVEIESGFARVRRQWQIGDRIQLDLPVAIERVVADDRVEEDRGRSAIQRGPIVYALEGVDNGGHVLDRTLPLDAALDHHFAATLLNGVEVITGGGITAVPYYAWNNRGRGEMTVLIAK